MDPLTPNTTAFLSYLSSTLEGNDGNAANNNNNNNNNNAPAKFDPASFNPFEFTSFSAFDPSKSAQNMNGQQPASLPPSAFFPIPGRDTPEDTPPSTNEASQSPEKPVQLNAAMIKGLNTSAVVDASGESEGESPHRGGRRASTHKRKAGLGVQKNRHVEDDEDDEDEDSDSGDGHEDKRVHQANKGASGPKKGGRKSIGGEEGKGGKESKAARRKEQNRAAQKAFRERREAKVKDLEDKVAELERKSYGTSVENENLRGILKRLQEENVALRQAAFTFSMPVNGAPQSAPSTGASTPFASAQPQRQQSKPPSPPNSTGDDVLRSINDVPAAQPRKSSGAVAPSPDSVASVRSGSVSTNDSTGPYRPMNLFSEPSHAFDVAALGGRPQMASHSSSDSNTNTQDTPRSISGVSPASTSTNGRTELDALWASFLQQGAPQKDQNQTWNMNKPTAFGQFENQPNPMSFVNNNAKVGATGNTNNWDKLAFRDTSATVQQAPQSQGQQQAQMGVQAPANAPQADPWSGMMDNSMDDFLASLTGANTAGLDNDAGANDDDFNAQLQQILGSNNASPSNAFDLPGMNPFSPTNYLNMSPSPLNSVSASNEPSPQTNSGSSASASASPESLVGINDQPTRGSSMDSAVAAMGPPKVDGESLYVLDEKGRVIKPSELWIRMGMQHESNLEHLLIDDLCDMMRAKATCKDGKAYIQASDAENMFKYKGSDPVHDARLRAIEQRAGIAPGAFTAPRR